MVINATKQKILRKHRPTTEKINAPYRGVSSKEDVTNLFMGATHDLFYIQRKIGEKEGVRGQKQFQSDNFSLILQGEGESATTNIDTAGTYVTLLNADSISQKLSDNLWTLSTGVVKKTVGKNIQLEASGLLNKAYTAQKVRLKNGDILYVRTKTKKIKGKANDCSISFVKNDETIAVRQRINYLDNDFIYTETKYYCEQNEEIEIRLYVYDVPAVLEATTIEVSDIKISYVSETNYSLPGLKKKMNQEMNLLESNIGFLKNVIKGGK